MGNLCSSESDPFSQPGRRLGSTPAAPASVSVPASASASRKPPRVGGPPRTLGGGSGAGSASSQDPSDARRKAAEAAEARQKRSQGGKLTAQLNAQRGKTDAAILKQASEEESRRRDMDQNAAALSHN
ncbi:hypothetical protein MMYC01_200524 [Madurella mycetomatis]|uniref:Uncharacterized protein n=1 Tax=Madurella mycetomatis TaxID=100816 RepID=A0A175WHH4_9PEZI|nr:hypothetical protein MMYC01_200524 [Madurella mycetomatis]